MSKNLTLWIVNCDATVRFLRLKDLYLYCQESVNCLLEKYLLIWDRHIVSSVSQLLKIRCKSSISYSSILQ